MSPSKTFLAIAALAAASPAAWGNYVGSLKPPRADFDPGTSLYTFASPAVLGLAPTLSPDNGFRQKLGYRPSRYFALQTESVDFGRGTAGPFINPSSLASGFRGTGFGVDTVATLPFWNKFSLYGRFGAYRGDGRPAFAPYTSSLLNEGARGTRVRYGLGLQYDFTKALGVRAELERYSPLGGASPADAEADQISVGVLWRF